MNQTPLPAQGPVDRVVMRKGGLLDYVCALSEKHYEQIGFLPRPRLEQYAERGQLWTETENDEWCGFMV